MSQEFHFSLEQKQLHAGLKRHSGYIVPAVEAVYNQEVTEVGMGPYNPITLLDVLTPTWPFPWLGGGADRLFTVEKVDATTASFDAWEGTSRTYLTDLTFPSFTMYDVPDMAVFDTYRIMVGTFGVMSGIDNNLVSNPNIPRARSCCNYKGQLVLGGILDSWHDCDETFIAHSNIGDVTMEPDWKNEAGYRPINYVGRVYKVRRLDEGVVVYGEKGVAFLTGVKSPAPTLGLKEIAKLNMASPEAADGGLKWQVVVDSIGYLWFVTKDGAERVGYKDALSTLTLSDVVVRYDGSMDRVFISDGDKCFIMTSEGMTQVYQVPSGVGTYQDTGYFIGVEDTEDYMLKVGPFDFGYNGLKTVYTVESDTGDKVEIEVLANGSFTPVKSVPLNDVGIGTPVVAGKSFMVVVTGSDYNEYPNHILLRWKMSDLRGLRGYIQPRQS